MVCQVWESPRRTRQRPAPASAPGPEAAEAEGRKSPETRWRASLLRVQEIQRWGHTYLLSTVYTHIYILQVVCGGAALLGPGAAEPPRPLHTAQGPGLGLQVPRPRGELRGSVPRPLQVASLHHSQHICNMYTTSQPRPRPPQPAEAAAQPGPAARAASPRPPHQTQETVLWPPAPGPRTCPAW